MLYCCRMTNWHACRSLSIMQQNTFKLSLGAVYKQMPLIMIVFQQTYLQEEISKLFSCIKRGNRFSSPVRENVILVTFFKVVFSLETSISEDSLDRHSCHNRLFNSSSLKSSSELSSTSASSSLLASTCFFAPSFRPFL